MAVDFTKCPRCGKIFAARTGKTHCVECMVLRLAQIKRIDEAIELRGLRTPEEIAAYAGIAVEEVTSLIQESPALSNGIDTHEPCRRCGRNPAQPHFGLCVRCSMKLSLAFGSAAEQLMAKATRKARKTKGIVGPAPTNVVQHLLLRRERAEHNRRTPMPRIRRRG